MLGYSHATSGAFTWLAVAPSVAHLLGKSMDYRELGVGAIACAGAALMPDLDHPQATIAYTFGFVSKLAAKGMSLISGGHRHMTHSIFFAVIFGTIAQLIALGGSTPAIILMFLLSAFALRGMGLVPPKTSQSTKGFVCIVEAALLTFAMTRFMPGTWWWLGLAAFLGCIVHCIGDTLTPEGVPWLWPMKTRFSLPIISHTGNVVERVIVGPLLSFGCLWLIYVNYSPLLFKK
jgi:membrane-bound metal-dependent hydrolase YbcI (DUF457 family)